MKMKKYSTLVIGFLTIIVFFSCEDQITVDLPKSEPTVVIDAWINNKTEKQVIKVMQTIPYFDQSFLPGINDAIVRVEDLTKQPVVYEFVKGEEDGTYEWEPWSDQPSFGIVGHEYKLTVQIDEAVYEAYSTMGRVPRIDSLTFRFEKGNSFFADSYVAGFYADDPSGPGDTYWIKTWKNGQFLNKPSEINISWDAGGSPGAIVDGITFIRSVRDLINPFDQDENGKFLSPYEPGDSIRVEIHSITNEAYTFLYDVFIQTNRPGGFAELFAQPMANVPSNIMVAGDEKNAAQVVGFFNVSAVSAKDGWLDPDKLPPRE